MAVLLVIMIVNVSKCYWCKLRRFCAQKTIMYENDVSDHDDNGDHQCGLKMPAMNKLSPMRRLCDPGQGRVHNQCAGFWSGWWANLWRWLFHQLILSSLQNTNLGFETFSSFLVNLGYSKEGHPARYGCRLEVNAFISRVQQILNNRIW